MNPWLLLASFATGAAFISMLVAFLGYFHDTSEGVWFAYEAAKWAFVGLLVCAAGLRLAHTIGLGAFLMADLAVLFGWNLAVRPIRSRRDRLWSEWLDVVRQSATGESCAPPRTK